MSNISNLAERPAVRKKSLFRRTAFFWREGVVVALAIFAAFICFSLLVSEVYESEAVLGLGAAPTLGDGKQPPTDEQVAERIRTTVREPRLLEPLLRELFPTIGEGKLTLEAATETARQSIDVLPRGAHAWALTFRFGAADLAQYGCERLTRAAILHAYPAEPRAAVDSEASSRMKVLEQRTRELAAFVAEHSEIALNGGGGAKELEGERSTAPATDSALMLLQRQKARLEASIAEARAHSGDASDANPYDTPADPQDLSTKEKMLGEVKVAIAARQSATARAMADSSHRSGVQGTKPAASPPALQAEWQRLVAAVVEAQGSHEAHEAKSAAPSVAQAALKIIEQASLPTKPIKPNRPLFILVGLTAGLWLGALWAFTRVAMDHDLRLDPEAMRARFDKSGSKWAAPRSARRGNDSLPQPATRRPTRRTSPKSSPRRLLTRKTRPRGRAPKEIRRSCPPRGAHGIRAGRDAFWRAPMKLRGNSLHPEGQVPEVIEHNSAPPQQASVSSIPAAPPVEAATSQSSAPPPERTVRPNDSPIPPPPSTGEAFPYTRSSWRPSGAPDSVSKTRSFASPVPPRKESDPPRKSSDPPERGLVVRGRAPDDVFTVINAPRGWRPDPSLASKGAPDELPALRDQLYRFAVSGCFVVAVTGPSNAMVGKSRTAVQLALLLAEPGRARVLLLEADFDRPAIQTLMRVDMPLSMGFSEQMRRRLSGKERAPWTLVRCLQNLNVLTEGLVRAPGLLSSGQFADALRDLRPFYDVIVVDGPAAGDSSDTEALNETTDGIVLVTRSDASATEVLAKSSAWFTRKQLVAVVAADD